jgi:hypothetical protein
MKFIPTFLLAGILGLAAAGVHAEDAKALTAAAVHKDQAALSGKLVRVKGKVVKVNNGIMKRNFVHVEDGSGDANTGKLIFTSTQTANVGDQVTATGRVTLNRDFGMGYMYPLLIEDSTITK